MSHVTFAETSQSACACDGCAQLPSYSNGQFGHDVTTMTCGSLIASGSRGHWRPSKHSLVADLSKRLGHGSAFGGG
jgi:hypothetical protein